MTDTSAAARVRDTEFRPFDVGRSERKADLGFDRYLFFGTPYVDEPGPQLYINDLDTGTTLPAHFHKVDQFQVFFGVPGAGLGRQPLSSVVVHYTDAYSTYGPLFAGESNRLKYATIRATASTFGGVMPAARDELLYRGRRHFTVDVERALQAHNGSSITPLVEPHPDGLAVTLARVPAGESIDVEVPAAITGRAYCVIEGVLRWAGKRYGQYSLGWSGPAGHAVLECVGDVDLAVVMMDFPSPPTPEARRVASTGAADAEMISHG